MVVQKESSLTPERPDFYIRRAIKGTPHVFQVYITPTQAWFIRVGGTATTEMIVASQGGLIGGLIAWYMQSRRKKKEAVKISENTAKTLEKMLAEHAANHVIPLTNFGDPSLEAGGWQYKKGTVIWKFDQPGEKKRVQCFFHKQEDVEAGVKRLPKLFPGIRIGVEFNAAKGKYLKKG